MALNCSTTADGILSAIYAAIVEVNLHLPKHKQLEPGLTTPLFGDGGQLDSLGLANFIVVCEEKLEEAVGVRLDLTENDPFSPETGHFLTVETLLLHVNSIANGNPRE